MDQKQRSGQHRVVETAVAGAGTGGGFAYGSGYAIGDRLVLTARHVLAPHTEQQVLVRISGEKDFRPATIEWVSEGLGDAALLSVAGAPWAGAPDAGAVRWGYIAEPDGVVPVHASGFPAAQAGVRRGEVVREPETMRGHVGALDHRTKRYAIDVDSAVPLLPADGGSPWSGMSGAALMDARKRILGVVVSNRVSYGGARLEATPVQRLFEDPKFVDLVGDGPRRLEAVTAEEAVALDAGGALPVLRTVPAARPAAELAGYELLRAENQAVGFLGRDNERRDLRAWCFDDRHVSLGLVAGSGGAGKTRLGLQLCRELAEAGWSAGFADEGVLAGHLNVGRFVDVVWPTLVILDYPDRLTDPAIRWIETLGQRRNGPRLRFLLLDRVPGDGAEPAAPGRSDLTWWAARGDFIARPSIVVRLHSGGLTGDDRFRHRESARLAFGGDTTDLSGLDLTDDVYRNPLKVHIAVLQAIKAGEYPEPSTLLSSFLKREMEGWGRRLTAYRLDDIGPGQARQIVALTTLTRPGIDVVPDLLPAIEDLADLNRLARGRIRDWLTELFGVGSRISALEPDLLAEELLAGTDELPRLAVAAYRLESSTAEHAADMLQSLSLASDNRDRVRGALRHLLTECLDGLMAQAAVEPGGRLPGLLEIALTRVLVDGAPAEAELAAAAATARRVPRREDTYRRLMSRLAKLALTWCDGRFPQALTAPVRVDALTDLAAEAALSAESAAARSSAPSAPLSSAPAAPHPSAFSSSPAAPHPSALSSAPAAALPSAAAMGLAAEALNVARTLPPDQSRRLARACYNVGTGLAADDPAAGRAALTEAAALVRGGGTDTAELIERCEILVNLGSCLADLDDQSAALAVCVEAIELRAGRDLAGRLLSPLAEPLSRLAASARQPLDSRPTGNPSRPFGEPQPLRPLAWSEPEHIWWTHDHDLALIRLAARLCPGLAASVTTDTITVSDALHGLTPHLHGTLLTTTLAESVELRRTRVTDDGTRAEFAKFLTAVAGELNDDADEDQEQAAMAVGYANEAVAEFQRLSPEHFARCEADFGKAVLVKVAALTQGGLDPLLRTPGQHQAAAVEVDEAVALLRGLPPTPDNLAVLAEVTAIRGMHLLSNGDVEDAAAALTEARDLLTGSGDLPDETLEMIGLLHVLVELLAGRRPYEWITSMSDAALAELDLDALPLLHQAIVIAAEDVSEGLEAFSGMLAAAGRLDLAKVFIEQSIEIARSVLGIGEDDDPEALLSLGGTLAQLSTLQIDTPEVALRTAQEAAGLIAGLPADDLMYPLFSGMIGLALARATLAVDPTADVVDVARSALEELSQSLDLVDEEGGIGSWPSVWVMVADARGVLANACLAAGRPDEAVGHAGLVRAELARVPASDPVVALILTSHLIEGQGEFNRGRYDVALTAFDQVIEGFEASGLSVAAVPGLADAAFLSAVCLQELGQSEPAVRRSRQAAAWWRDGAATMPIRVAANLAVQAVALIALGNAAEADLVSQEAVTAARAAGAEAQLVNALRVRGQCLALLGRVAEAVALLDEALATGSPEVPPIEFGLVHLWRGNCRAELGQVGAALEAFLAGAAILREVDGQTVLLVAMLAAAARCHRQLGDNRAGLPLVTEAAGRCRELIVDEVSAAGLADAFTAALWEVVVAQETEGGRGPADAAAAEGIAFVRAWGFDRRAEVTETTLHYANLLAYHAAALAEGGRAPQALPFSVEATGILRDLAGQNPDAFGPAFLGSLAGQAQLLRLLGQDAEAGAAEREHARWAATGR